MSEVKNIVIVAPHPDDELISSFLVLSDQKNSISIIYSPDIDNIRREEALKLKLKFTNVKSQHFCQSIPPIFLNPKTTFYFPDPIFEHHYLHRQCGAIGESLLRNGLDVIFYSINMQAPYCFEVKNWLKKKEALDEVYSSQSDLWKNDAKYYLFEGRSKWLIQI
jgi:hypothetical protein